MPRIVHCTGAQFGITVIIVVHPQSFTQLAVVVDCHVSGRAAVPVKKGDENLTDPQRWFLAALRETV